MWIAISHFVFYLFAIDTCMTNMTGNDQWQAGVTICTANALDELISTADEITSSFYCGKIQIVGDMLSKFMTQFTKKKKKTVKSAFLWGRKPFDMDRGFRPCASHPGKNFIRKEIERGPQSN